MLRTLLFRRFISTLEVAKILSREYPTQDPRSLKESRVRVLARYVIRSRPGGAAVDIAKVHETWKDLYDAQLHETAFDEMADPGEQCDGELPSWTRDRLSVEKDKNYVVPSVCAHEASLRLKQTKGDK